ncbi:MAG: DNA repair protein RecO [Patescibacteria group bacterium]|nr:DNA repair protein RecO [Patescibacteria group bacterium]
MVFFDKIKTEAFVLKKKILLNKDLLIFLFSQERGKIVVLAKGVRKINSKRSSYLETGNLVDIVLNVRNNFYYLKEINLLSGFYKIKQNKDKVKIIYQFFYILDKILPENKEEKNVYNFTKLFFINLNKQKNIDNELIYKYTNKILILLGYIKKKVSKNEIDRIFFELTNEKIPLIII